MGCRLSQNSVEKEFTQVVDIYQHRGWTFTKSQPCSHTGGGHLLNLNHTHTGGGHVAMSMVEI